DPPAGLGRGPPRDGARQPDPGGASPDRPARAHRRGRREAGPGAELGGRRRAAAGPGGKSAAAPIVPVLTPEQVRRWRALTGAPPESAIIPFAPPPAPEVAPGRNGSSR